jgi:hypothetical protein
MIASLCTCTAESLHHPRRRRRNPERFATRWRALTPAIRAALEAVVVRERQAQGILRLAALGPVDASRVD